MLRFIAITTFQVHLRFLVKQMPFCKSDQFILDCFQNAPQSPKLNE